jgi:hypothetical protein
MNIRKVIESLESKLTTRGESLELMICGGAAIHLLGYSNRPTKDIDVILPKISEGFTPLIQEIAKEQNLAENWLNNGPESLKYDLESGWELRTTLLYQGDSLVIRGLSRADLIFSKLYAMCDRREDIRDLLAMEVTEEELQTAGKHVKDMDGNPDWPSWVDICILEILEEGRYNE